MAILKMEAVHGNAIQCIEMSTENRPLTTTEFCPPLVLEKSDPLTKICFFLPLKLQEGRYDRERREPVGQPQFPVIPARGHLIFFTLLHVTSLIQMLFSYYNQWQNYN